MNQLSVEPEEVIKAVEQVRNPEVGASDYTFLDDLETVHPTPQKKGNDGLANWITDLAIFRVNGKTVVDQDLVEIADEMLGEEAPRERTRIEGITYNSDARPGGKLSLADKEEEVDGHEKLLNMVEEFYRATGQEEKIDENTFKKLSPQGNDARSPEDYEASGYLLPNPENDTIYSKPETKLGLNGGEIMPAIEERADEIEERVQGVYDLIDGLPGDEDYDEIRSALDTLADTAEAARAKYQTVRDDLDERDEELEELYDALESAHERVEAAAEYVVDRADEMEDLLDETVEDIEELLDEGSDYIEEAQGYLEDVMDDDIPDMPEAPDRVEEQLGRTD